VRRQRPDGVERRLVAGRDGHEDRRGDRGQCLDEGTLGRPPDRHVEQQHRHPPERVEGAFPGGARRDAEERRAVGDLPRVELRLEAPGQLRNVARGSVERLERARGHVPEPELAQRRRERPGEPRKPRHRCEVPERPLPHRLEAHPRGDGLRAERRGRRHGKPCQLPRGTAHGDLHEARAMQPEGGAPRRRDPPGQIVGRVAGGAHDQDFRGGGNPLDERRRRAKPLGGRGRLEHLEHRP
jgi:hypothetical protein